MPPTLPGPRLSPYVMPPSLGGGSAELWTPEAARLSFLEQSPVTMSPPGWDRR